MRLYKTAALEGSLVVLDEDDVCGPGDVIVVDIETGDVPRDRAGKSLAVVRAWSDRVEAFDYDAPVTGDAFPTHTVYGRYIIVAQPKER
jgi:hypothetical protein